MILADTSVWADHLRHGNPVMATLLQAERIVVHPFVIGELAMGDLPDRPAFLRALHHMESAARASEAEVLRLIESRDQHGSGLGWIDAHLLASALLGPAVRLWTRDRRLNAAAEQLGCSAQLHH